MGVLQFDGVDDRIRWTTLATALQNLPTGAYTLAVLFKRGTPTGTWDALSYLNSGSGSGSAEAGISISDVNTAFMDLNLSQSNPKTATTFTNTTSPYLWVLSKAAGASAPRLGWKLGSGGAWTHENLDNSPADQSAATILGIGEWQAGDIFEGWIGLVAWWSGAMSDANKEALDDNWRTSDWWASVHGQPVFLAELNVAGASVVDLAGNASSLTVVGTTLDAAETLDNWNFDGTGAAPKSLIVAPRPMRHMLVR